ncbi:MAG: hypothetical protein ACT4OY_06855 [Alphaproteobacteria bacterium]
MSMQAASQIDLSPYEHPRKRNAILTDVRGVFVSAAMGAPLKNYPVALLNAYMPPEDILRRRNMLEALWQKAQLIDSAHVSFEYLAGEDDVNLEPGDRAYLLSGLLGLYDDIHEYDETAAGMRVGRNLVKDWHPDSHDVLNITLGGAGTELDQICTPEAYYCYIKRGERHKSPLREPNANPPCFTVIAVPV